MPAWADLLIAHDAAAPTYYSAVMIAVIPHTVAERFARHNLLRILPYTFTNTLTSWGMPGAPR